MISAELKQIVDPNDEACCEYHLAHKCREWALGLGYHLIEYLNSVDIIQRTGCVKLIAIDGKTEYDAERIFKACEWILNQGKQDEQM